MDTPNSASDKSYNMRRLDDGIVEVIVRKVLSIAEVESLFDELRPLYASSRGPDGIVRVLVLMKAIQSPTVALRVRSNALALARPGDRRAYVVATFLSKLQMTRLGGDDSHAVFADQAAAEIWLRAR